MVELETLRERIALADRRIMEAIAERDTIAREIGRHKMAHDLPIRNLDVEEEVETRFLSLAREMDVEESTARDLARVAIRDAVEVQGQIMKPASPRRILVVGGAGKMGTWVCRYLRSRGHQVAVVDPSPTAEFERKESLEEGVSWAEVVVLSTPIAITDSVMESVFELDPSGLVFDIASIKEPVISRLRAAAERGFKACSVHPMFGPDVPSLYDRNVVVCDCGSPEAVEEARELFDGTGALMMQVSVEKHDELMSFVLGLSHAVSLAFFDALSRSGFDHSTLERSASTTFRKQMDTSRDVAFENPELYFDIQYRNPFAGRALELLGMAVNRIRDAALEGDKESFIGIMDDGRTYFGGKG